MSYVYIFTLMVILDILWATYILQVAKRSEVKAGLYAAALLGISGLVTMSYIENPKLLPAAMLGAFVGTVLAIKFEERIR